MTYDEEITTDIPAYRILDCMIEDNTDPKIIIQYLSKFSNEELEDIVETSTFIFKIMSTDFILKLNSEEMNVVFKIMQVRDFEESGIFLAWQIVHSRNNIQQNILNRMGDYINMHNGFIRHPYSSIFKDRYRMLDDLVSKAENDEEIAKAIIRLKPDALSDLVKYGCSLYKYRILTSSVVELLPELFQYIILTNFNIGEDMFAYSERKSTIKRPECFLRQILFSNVCNEAKKIAYDKYRMFFDKIRSFHFIRENKDLYDEDIDPSFLMINMDLLGDVDRENVLMFHLLYHPEKIVFLYENCKEELENSLPIGDFPEYLDRQMNSWYNKNT